MRLGTSLSQREKFIKQTSGVNRLSSPHTARPNHRMRKIYKRPKSKAEALSSINNIYKQKLATLDKAVHILKSKKRELAKLESEVMLLYPSLLENKEPQDKTLKSSDSKTEKYDLSQSIINNNLQKYKNLQKVLNEELIFKDTLIHILNRDELILYHKKIKLNNLKENLRRINLKFEGNL